MEQAHLRLKLGDVVEGKDGKHQIVCTSLNLAQIIILDEPVIAARVQLSGLRNIPQLGGQRWFWVAVPGGRCRIDWPRANRGA
jgi:hypothetical protein